MTPYPAWHLHALHDLDGVRLKDTLGLLAGRKLSSRRGVFRSPLPVARLDQCRILIAPKHDPYALPKDKNGGPTPWKFWKIPMVGDETEGAMTVPNPAETRALIEQARTDLLMAHILDPANPDTGELEVVIPFDLCDFDDEAEIAWGGNDALADGVDLVPPDWADEYWEGVHEDELELSMNRDKPTEIVYEVVPEHHENVESLSTLRDFVPPLFGA